eukprot:GHVQ01039686.1.p1 GENE.GHVQ01039686.1~~GHVQ01039686.1.p1  ORF type:complete len:1135 (-),score=225.30 GHVQ01039686.1:3622-7026(-)
MSSLPRSSRYHKTPSNTNFSATNNVYCNSHGALPSVPYRRAPIPALWRHPRTASPMEEQQQNTQLVTTAAATTPAPFCNNVSTNSYTTPTTAKLYSTRHLLLPPCPHPRRHLPPPPNAPRGIAEQLSGFTEPPSNNQSTPQTNTTGRGCGMYGGGGGGVVVRQRSVPPRNNPQYDTMINPVNQDERRMAKSSAAGFKVGIREVRQGVVASKQGMTPYSGHSARRATSVDDRANIGKRSLSSQPTSTSSHNYNTQFTSPTNDSSNYQHNYPSVGQPVTIHSTPSSTQNPSITSHHLPRLRQTKASRLRSQHISQQQKQKNLLQSIPHGDTIRNAHSPTSMIPSPVFSNTNLPSHHHMMHSDIPKPNRLHSRLPLSSTQSIPSSSTPMSRPLTPLHHPPPVIPSVQRPVAPAVQYPPPHVTPCVQQPPAPVIPSVQHPPPPGHATPPPSSLLRRQQSAPAIPPPAHSTLGGGGITAPESKMLVSNPPPPPPRGRSVVRGDVVYPASHLNIQQVKEDLIKRRGNASVSRTTQDKLIGYGAGKPRNSVSCEPERKPARGNSNPPVYHADNVLTSVPVNASDVCCILGTEEDHQPAATTPSIKGLVGTVANFFGFNRAQSDDHCTSDNDQIPDQIETDPWSLVDGRQSELFASPRDHKRLTINHHRFSTTSFHSISGGPSPLPTHNRQCTAGPRTSTGTTQHSQIPTLHSRISSSAVNGGNSINRLTVDPTPLVNCVDGRATGDNVDYMLSEVLQGELAVPRDMPRGREAERRDAAPHDISSFFNRISISVPPSTRQTFRRGLSVEDLGETTSEGYISKAKNALMNKQTQEASQMLRRKSANPTTYVDQPPIAHNSAALQSAAASSSSGITCNYTNNTSAPVKYPLPPNTSPLTTDVYATPHNRKSRPTDVYTTPYNSNPRQPRPYQEDARRSVSPLAHRYTNGGLNEGTPSYPMFPTTGFTPPPPPRLSSTFKLSPIRTTHNQQQHLHAPSNNYLASSTYSEVSSSWKDFQQVPHQPFSPYNSQRFLLESLQQSDIQQSEGYNNSSSHHPPVVALVSASSCTTTTGNNPSPRKESPLRRRPSFSEWYRTEGEAMLQEQKYNYRPDNNSCEQPDSRRSRGRQSGGSSLRSRAKDATTGR